MGVAGISGQDPVRLAASPAAQAPEFLPRPVKSQQDGAVPVARLGPRPKEEQVQRAAAETVAYEGPKRTGTRLRIDAASKRIVAQIIGENNEVLKQIPPEEVLKISAKFQEMNGKLFDRKI